MHNRRIVMRLYDGGSGILQTAPAILCVIRQISSAGWLLKCKGGQQVTQNRGRALSLRPLHRQFC